MVKTVISTFAGCGGSSLGYKLAGFKELLAVEFEKNAIETFKLNFPDVPVYAGDITKLSGTECMKLTGIKPGELDVLDGSPPCQGFSISGKRKMNDCRNLLFMEYVRLIKELQPKVFVMENVTGIVKGYMKQIYLTIIKTLRDCGYKAVGQVLNAANYNVPQMRERVIIIGVRNDLNANPSHPKPQTKLITPRQAFKNCPKGEIKPLPDWLKKAAAMMIAGNYSTTYTKKAFKKTKGNTAGAMNTKLLSWNRVACTLVKSEISTTGIIHPDRERYLTIPEMKRLSSFPDDFEFIGTRKDMVARIGNCVPPNLMKAIAEHIKTVILEKGALQGAQILTASSNH